MPDSSHLSSFPSRLTSLFLGCILAVYVGLSLYQIDLPGLHYDEAFEAVPALQLLHSQPVTTFRDHGLVVGRQTFPLMTQDYIGAVNTYLSIPFIAVFGATPTSLRVMSIMVGVITLWLTYALTSQLIGCRWVGLVAALLLSVDPTFIFWNRQGIFVTAVTAPIGLAATLCWLKYLRRDGLIRGWALGGAFLFGLGIYAKFLFIWLIGALICAVILINWKQFNALIRHTGTSGSRWRKTGLIALAFLLGCWPLILYNIQTGGTIRNISQNASTSYYGVNNLAFGTNLLERLGQLSVMINGRHLWYLGDTWGSPLPFFLFVFLLVFVVAITTRSFILYTLTAIEPKPSTTKIVLFPFLVIGLVILFSIGTVSALWVTHFALLMPWPSMAMAISIWYLLSDSSIIPRSLRYAVLWFILLLLVGNGLINTVRYHKSLRESGGLSSHSDAIYDLSDWLDRHATGPVAAMDWGLAAPVVYLTGGQVVPLEVFGYMWESDMELMNRLKSLVSQSDTLYLWRAPDEIIFDRSQEFKSLYRPLELEENIEEAFYERSGRPLLGVTRLVKKGTAENPP